jgi:hypothetical protein
LSSQRHRAGAHRTARVRSADFVRRRIPSPKIQTVCSSRPHGRGMGGVVQAERAGDKFPSPLVGEGETGRFGNSSLPLEEGGPGWGSVSSAVIYVRLIVMTPSRPASCATLPLSGGGIKTGPPEAYGLFLSRCRNLPWGPAFLCRATKVPPLALSFAVEGSKRGSAAPGGGQADRVRSVFAFMSVPLMAPVRDGARLYCASHISEHCSERPVRPQGRGLGVSKHSGHQAFLNPVLVNFTKLRASALASAWHYFHRAGGTCALWLLREVRGI